jgi:uncharacterized membrane protein
MNTHFRLLLPLLVAAVIGAVSAFANNTLIDSATKQRSLRQLAEEIKSTEGVLRRLDGERDLAVKAFTERLKKLNEEEHSIRENLQAARQRLSRETDKHHREVLLAVIKSYENEKYPGVLAEIAKVNQSRMEWNSRAAERAAFRAPYEEKLRRLRAEESELRARPVIGGGSATGEIGGSTGGTPSDTDSIYKNLQAMPPEQRREILQQMLRDVDKYERDLTAREARIEAARKDLLRLNAMSPFDKIRFGGEEMEVREARKRLSDSIAKAVQSTVRDRAFFVGERARIQMEFSKLR